MRSRKRAPSGMQSLLATMVAIALMALAAAALEHANSNQSSACSSTTLASGSGVARALVTRSVRLQASPASPRLSAEQAALAGLQKFPGARVEHACLERLSGPAPVRPGTYWIVVFAPAASSGPSPAPGGVSSEAYKVAIVNADSGVVVLTFLIPQG